MRLLTGTEEGIITRLLDSELVEVAIDNDFTIPVLRREVVVVAAEEDKNFDRSAPTLGPGQQPGKAANASKKGGQPRQPAPKLAPKTAPAGGLLAAKAPARPSLADALHAAASSGPGAARPTAVGAAAAGAAAARGLFLALVPQSPELLGAVLINNTGAEVLFTLADSTAARPYRTLAAGQLGPRTASKPLSFLHLKDFEEWPALVFQLLPTRPNGDTGYELLTKRQTFKAATFYGSRRPAPVVEKEAYLFALDEQQAAALTPEKLLAADAPAVIRPVAVAAVAGGEPAAAAAAPASSTAPASTAPAPTVLNAEALRAQLTGDAPRPAGPPPAPAVPVVAPPHEVDLHLEVLRPDGTADLSNTAMLRLQLDAFEDTLSRALATNMHEIVFIHGIGAGVLRKEIHRQLSRNKDIKFFEDAQKGKFGFGATLVRLK